MTDKQAEGFTRESLIQMRDGHAGLCCPIDLAAFTLRLLDERDDYKMQAEVATAYDAVMKGESAWLVSNSQVERWKKATTARREAVEALRFYAKWEGYMKAMHAQGCGDQIKASMVARAIVAKYDKEQADE